MNHREKLQSRPELRILFGLAILFIIIAFGFGVGRALAQPILNPVSQAALLHPTFELLDADGNNVLESGKPFSTMNTCGECHDTEFIVSHSYHADAGLGTFSLPGRVEDGRPWDSSLGYFGKWNSITYRYLSVDGDGIIDLTTPEWLQTLGLRHPGGGPGITSRSGIPLRELLYQTNSPETNIVNPDTGELIPWDWSDSGVVEMNCFLCHISSPNNDARVSELKQGNFGWANTATLLGSGIVTKEGNSYTWAEAAFDPEGKLLRDFVNIQDPKNENCGLCHGLVHDDLEQPLVMTECSPDSWRTVTTGQIVSPQRLTDSGLNLANKAELTRSWDVHAERLVECTDCHYALNNPVYYREDRASQPEHLEFDPRRIEISEYLLRPVHQFARGQSAQSTVAPELKDTMRRCESCHSIEATHDWLPYKERHVSAISCESCHIPQMYTSAAQQMDWTVVSLDGEPQTMCRGVEGSEKLSVKTLVTGYEPILLPQQDVNGNTKLAPFNLVSAWFWVYGNRPQPVSQRDLQTAWLDGDRYHADIIAAFDDDMDGVISSNELRIDSEVKERVIAARLESQGLENPRIQGEVQPYSINHTVTHGEWATKDCDACHQDESRLTQSFLLSSYLPGGVLPAFVKDSNTSTQGELYQDDSGALYYQPVTGGEGLYILGHDYVPWIDLFGALVFVGTLLAVFAHGGMRLLAALRQPKHEPEVKRVYMYTIYERLWHWTQTFVILGLLFTGLIIHKPELFGFLSFRGVVLVHNIFAAILVVNAALSLFYHLASGEIRQYIPRPRGFFDQAITQAKFYIQGIFRNDAHPFEKTPEKKLNPLQQLTYFGLLNVLLPLQVITGAFIWGAQRWPEISSALGGLSFLSPFHTLISWLLASFVVAHVYLTTTGHSPTAAIDAMMFGWDEVEVQHIAAEEVLTNDNINTVSTEQA